MYKSRWLPCVVFATIVFLMRAAAAPVTLAAAWIVMSTMAVGVAAVVVMERISTTAAVAVWQGCCPVLELREA